jgi:hypothetical protein
MKIKSLFVYIISCVLLLSCDMLPTYQEFMKMDQTEYEIPAAGGVLKVSFIPLSDWSATCGEGYISLSPSSGFSSTEKTELSIKVQENTHPVQRVAEILIRFETNDITLTVTQAAAAEKPVEPEPPGTPETPENPEKPGTPENPENPGTPENPGDGSGSTEDVVPGKDINTK